MGVERPGEDVGSVPAKPAEETSAPATEDCLSLEPAQVRSAADLPLALFLGVRDDATFARTDAGWACLYRCEGEPFLELRGEGEAWQLAKFWQGRRQGGGRAEGTLLDALKLQVLYTSDRAAEDPWEGFCRQKVEAIANVQYQPPTKGDPIIESIPEGRYKALICPLAYHAVDALAQDLDYYRREHGARLALAEGERVLQVVSPQPIAEEQGRHLALEVAAFYGRTPGEFAISYGDMTQGRLWRVQIRQMADFAYFLFPWRRAIPLVRALRERDVVGAPLGEGGDQAELLLGGGLLVGDYRLADTVALVQHQAWLPNLPAALATFPPAPKELLG